MAWLFGAPFEFAFIPRDAATNFRLSNGTNTFTILATNVYLQAATNVLSVNLLTNVTLTYDTNGNLTGDGTRVKGSPIRAGSQ